MTQMLWHHSARPPRLATFLVCQDEASSHRRPPKEVCEPKSKKFTFSLLLSLLRDANIAVLETLEDYVFQLKPELQLFLRLDRV